MNALGYVNMDQGIHKGKLKVAWNEKRKKLLGFSFFYKYRKFWSFSLEFKLECKTFILEECYLDKKILVFYFTFFKFQLVFFWLIIVLINSLRKKKNYKKLTKFSIKVYTRYGTFLGMIFPVSLALLWSNACLKKCNTSEISGNFSVTYLAKIDLSEESVSLNRTCNFSNPSKASQRYPT